MHRIAVRTAAEDNPAEGTPAVGGTPGVGTRPSHTPPVDILEEEEHQQGVDFDCSNS
ncbi:hypothetical protein ABTG52_08435 [Acinetobacter baumannii]